MKKRYDNIYMKRFMYFNLYVIKGVDGDILIDTGFIGMKRKLKRWLDKFNIKLVILTHAHVDHVWNVSYIKDLYDCKVAIGNMDIDNIDNTKIKAKPSKKNHTRWTKLMNFGMKKFVPTDFDIDYSLEDGQVIDKYGLNLKVVSLNGHTNGSIGILYNNYLFAGDALVNRRKHPSIAYQNQSNTSAINSYQKILDLSPELIFVGHDKVITLDKLKYN